MRIKAVRASRPYLLLYTSIVAARFRAGALPAVHRSAPPEPDLDFRAPVVAVPDCLRAVTVAP